MVEHAAIPRYQEIINDLATKIDQKIYEAGELLPSENELSKLYGVSVPTVRKALAELVYRNVIYRIKGKGTFVQTDQPKSESLYTREDSGKLICFIMLVDRYDDAMIKMISGAQQYLFNKNCSMNILCGAELAKTEKQLVQNCLDNNVDGAIWFSGAPEENVDGLKALASHNVPVVMLDRGPAQMPFTLISCYNQDGGYQMAKHLLQLGHRKIVFASDLFHLPAEQSRFRGYQMALNEFGLDQSSEYLFRNTPEKMDELIALIRREKITAVQCVHDKLAARLVRRLTEEGLNVPADVSVGGFDDAAESEYSYPRITSIYQPFEAMGAEAARQVLKRVVKPQNHCQYFLPVHLVVKDSTAPVRADKP